METTFKKYEFMVLNIPHASTNIPEHYMPNWDPRRMMRIIWQGNEESLFSKRERNKKLYAELYSLRSRPLIDYYTDELFDTIAVRIRTVASEICRTLCDVERMVNDPLEEKGFGIFCKRMVERERPCGGAGSRIVFKREFFDPTCKHLVEYYVQHQSRLIQAIVSSAYFLNKYYGDNSVLLLDCHSFSSMPTALCDPGPLDEQVDICIGYNDDATRPREEMIDFVVAHFEELGYKVGRNTPFSHSKTVECPVPYHSLMIEVNKRCYMDEQTLEKTEGFARLRRAILSLYSKILMNGGNSIYL